MTITAQYHGSCTECGDPITPGQRIEPDDDAWRHTACGELADEVPCVCEKCWLVHAPNQEVCW